MTAAFFAVVLVADLLAVVCQAYFPPIVRFNGATVLLFPVLLTYGALALPFAGTLAVAFCNGLLWDALTVQIVQINPYVSQPLVEETRFGWSILLFGVLAIMTHGLRPLFLRGRWDLHCLASGFCTMAILAAQYAAITFSRGPLILSRDLVLHVLLPRVLLPGFFAMLLAPVVYVLFYGVANLLDYPVRLVEDRRRQPERL